MNEQNRPVLTCVPLFISQYCCHSDKNKYEVIYTIIAKSIHRDTVMLEKKRVLSKLFAIKLEAPHYLEYHYMLKQ